MSDLDKKIESAIKLINAVAKMAERRGEVLELAYSGGKDSDVLLQLARMSGAKFVARHKITTIDPAGTLAHARENGVEIVKPKISFTDIITKFGLPSRKYRICCKLLKEYKTAYFVITGIRQAESQRRKSKYTDISLCKQFSKGEYEEQFLPILYWTNEDVREFIERYRLKVHRLYYNNNKLDVSQRLGCMGCPLLSHKNRIKSFQKYPKMILFYLKAMQKHFETHPTKASAYKDVCEWLYFDLYLHGNKKELAKIRESNFDSKTFFETTYNIKIELNKYG